MMLEAVPNAGIFTEARWRRRVGLGDSAAKVFVCTEDGFYEDLRAALFNRGWRQAPWGSTTFWHMAIALKPIDVDYAALRPGQTANSFSGSTALCNKASLVATLAGSARVLPVPLAAFVPRSYDLDEPDDYAAFVDDYRATSAYRILTLVASEALSAASVAGIFTNNATTLTKMTTATGAAILLRALDALTVAGPGAKAHAWDATIGDEKFIAWVTANAAAGFNVNLGVLRAAVRVAERAVPDFDDDAVLDGVGVGGGGVLLGLGLGVLGRVPVAHPRL